MRDNRCIHGAAALLLSIVAGGCSARNAKPDSLPVSGLAATLHDLGEAPASLLVAEPMRPFFGAGLGFIVLGGLLLCLRAQTPGFILLAIGAFTTATGVLFIQYPWAVLLMTLAAAAAAVLAAYDRLRARRELERDRTALEAATEVIQNIPEGKAVKNGIAALGHDVETAVRQAVDPIKEKLRQNGKI